MKKKKIPFSEIKQFDARGDYPECMKGLPDYQHPIYFQPAGLSGCKDLNIPENLSNALASVENSYNKDKQSYIPEVLVIYNYGITLWARHTEDSYVQ